MKRVPLVSIIIINWNGGRVFSDCLSSLAKISYPNWELVIVDNGSADGSQWLPQNFQPPIVNYQLIKNRENVGFARANNQGYEVARGRYILLLNNDTKVEPDFLTGLVDRMEEDSSIGVIQPKIYLMDKPGYLDNAGSFMTRIGFLQHWGFLRKDGKEFNKGREIFSAKGACMLIRREVIEKIGLFDEDFFSYFEESDFCWRVWLSNYKVVYHPLTHIYHKVGFTIRRLDVFNINYHYYKNRIYSLIKNLETKNLFLILLPHLTISLGIAVAFIIRLQPKNSFFVLGAINWNLSNLRKILIVRNKVQTLRKVSDGYLFSRLMRPISWMQYITDFKRVERDLKRKP